MDLQDHVYSNDEITVTFNPRKCINAGKCARELAEVFRTSVIPWIHLEGTETERIVNQIHKCPSGALQCHFNHKEAI